MTPEQYKNLIEWHKATIEALETHRKNLEKRLGYMEVMLGTLVIVLVFEPLFRNYF